MQSFLEFLANNLDKLFEQCLEHIGLTFLSLLLAVLIAVPLGIFISRREQLAGPILGIAGVLQTIPSIALLGFLIPVLGIGIQPAIVALFLYAILPILRNVYTGIKGVEPGIIEAARGMGMSENQMLRRVQLPLALPVIFAGVRTAAVINVGVATLAAYIGAGGLGEFIFGGITLNNSNMILAGALPAALLALLADQLLGWWQRGSQRSGGGLALILLLPLLSSFYWLPQQFSPGMRAAFEPEFMGRPDGYDHLLDTYNGLSFSPVVLNAALMYEALRSGRVDAICGYSTEGRIRAFDLQTLDDDQHAFPPYECAFIYKKERAEQYPEAFAALDKLSGLLNDSTMTELNFQVDYRQESPEDVARGFLQSVGLYQADRKQGGEVITIGSKIFTEQYILTELIAMIINGYTDLDVEKIPGLGGTKICFDALRNDEIDIYPEYTGTAFLVLLQPDEKTRNELITDPPAVYNYVKEAFANQFDLSWQRPLGFSNTYAIIVRREMATQKGWKTIGDLSR